MSSTTFADRVHAVVRSIPVGEVRTYGEVAQLAGSPRAARAVGQLMKRNQRSYLTTKPDQAVPCHRVVAAGQRLGGFNGGQRAKIRLLQLEGWSVSSHGRLESGVNHS